jgi:predicted ArsR family transcriptional regulator
MNATGRRRGPAARADTGKGRPEPTAGRREEILAIVRASASPLSILDIARQLDVHPNTVRFHLEALTGSGRAERVEAARTGPGRPPLMFRAQQGMDPSGPRNYRLLADILVNSLAVGPDPAGRAIDAGRAWGRQLADAPPEKLGTADDDAIGRLTGILGHLGFAPELRSAGASKQIGLRHCPFLDLIDNQARVICPVHLGLMQGAMSALGASVTVERLDPFAEPDLCLAHLGPVSAAS